MRRVVSVVFYFTFYLINNKSHIRVHAEERIKNKRTKIQNQSESRTVCKKKIIYLTSVTTKNVIRHASRSIFTDANGRVGASKRSE